MHTHTNADDIEPTYSLVASVFRLAIRDARRGCPEAREWLRCVAPDYYDELVQVDRAGLEVAGYGR